MRGCRIPLLLLAFALLAATTSRAAELAPREKVLQHLAGKISDRGNYRNHEESIKVMGTNAVLPMIEILGSQPAQADQWYATAPEALRARMTPAQYHSRLQYEASQSLHSMPDIQPYLPKLIALLQDPRKDVRRQTAWSLWRHAYKDNDLLLTALPALRDKEAEVRGMMIGVLSPSAGVPEVKAALEQTLQDPEESVRSSAAYNLLMRADKNHPAALETLVSLFTSTNVNTRYNAAHYYTISTPADLRLETRLIPIYTNALSVGDTNLQGRALTSLSRYGRRVQHLVPELQKYLSSPNQNVREAATNALQEIQPEVLPGTPSAPASRELVLQHLQAVYSTNQAVAFQSIKAMGTNAVPLLIEVLGYETTQADQWYEKAYAKAPASVQKRMSKPEALEKLRGEASLLLLNMRETHLYMTNLFALLQDQRPEVRRHSASLISHHMLNRGRQMEDSVMLECLPALKDSDPQVRRHIAYAFAHKGAGLPRAKAALEATLNDPDEKVRQSVAYALTHADGNHAEALQTLKALFTSADVSTRYFSAIYYLLSSSPGERLDDEMIPVFTGVLSGSDKDMQEGASRSLGRFGARARSAVPELQKLLQSPDPELQKTVREALEKIAPQTLPPAKP